MENRFELLAKLLRINDTKVIQFEAKVLIVLREYETLNHRVQGSSPCAPTTLRRFNCDLSRGRQMAVVPHTDRQA